MRYELHYELRTSKPVRKLKDDIEQKRFAAPHPTQLSRARLKLDMLLMKLRQQEWARCFRKGRCGEDSGQFVLLSADASPQAGTELLMIVEDRVPRNRAAEVVGASPEQLSQWGLQSHIITSTLPLGVLGSGACGTSAKFEVLAHCARLDCCHNEDLAHAAHYAASVISFTADYGVEAHLVDVPNVPLRAMYMSNIAASRGLLADTHADSTAAANYLVFQDESETAKPDDDDDVAFVTHAPSPSCGAHSDAATTAARLSDDPDPDTDPCFGLQAALMVPGVKHTIDNIESEVLSSLAWGSHFEDRRERV